MRPRPPSPHGDVPPPLGNCNKPSSQWLNLLASENNKTYENTAVLLAEEETPCSEHRPLDPRGDWWSLAAPCSVSSAVSFLAWVMEDPLGSPSNRKGNETWACPLLGSSNLSLLPKVETHAPSHIITQSSDRLAHGAGLPRAETDSSRSPPPAPGPERPQRSDGHLAEQNRERTIGSWPAGTTIPSLRTPQS